MIDKRLYITGGVCPIYEGLSERGDSVHEAFGEEYNLPNRVAYNETCANIAIAMWAHRMLLLTNKAIYGDWMENILFNAGISGASLDMTRYFYANPLAHQVEAHIKQTFLTYSHVPNERFLTFDCWCCPPQLWRTFSGMPKWIYALSENDVSINIFAGCQLDTYLKSGEPVKIDMITNYPWDKQVNIKVKDVPQNGIKIFFRIPVWCNNATYNGKAIKAGIHEVEVFTGDNIDIIVPMQAMLYQANPMVEQSNGMLAVKRGSVVYCLEGCDIAGGISINELAIPIDAIFNEVNIEDLPHNMIGLKTELVHRPKGEGLYYPAVSDDEKRIPVRFIPYFAWANRQEDDMSVWLPRA